MECVICGLLTLSARYRFCSDCWKSYGKLTDLAGKPRPRPEWVAEMVKLGRHEHYVKLRDYKRGNMSLEVYLELYTKNDEG